MNKTLKINMRQYKNTHKQFFVILRAVKVDSLLILTPR